MARRGASWRGRRRHGVDLGGVDGATGRILENVTATRGAFRRGRRRDGPNAQLFDPPWGLIKQENPGTETSGRQTHNILTHLGAL